MTDLEQKQVDQQHMEKAIALAEQCKPREERIPKVGAVIAIGKTVIGRGHRGTGNPGDDDHAEMIALNEVADETQLPEATLYTTLEPCTKEVRSDPLKCCAELIKQYRVKRVYIGTLDPNQGVRGKGLWELQSHGIAVELFPPELATRLLALNNNFIRVQQTLGIRFTNLEPGKVIRTWDKKGVFGIRGTFLNPPGDNVFAFTGTGGGQWWPQPYPLEVTGEGEWAVNIHFGSYGPHTVCIVQTSDLGTDLVLYYRKITKMNVDREQLTKNFFRRTGTDGTEILQKLQYKYPPIDMGALPKGIEPLATVEITVEYPPVKGFDIRPNASTA